MSQFLATKRSAPALVLSALAVLLILAGIYRVSKPAPPLADPGPTFDLPPLSASPSRNASPDATYVGIAACAECHANEYRTYRQTAHSLALSDLVPAAEPADGSFVHGASGRVYTIYRQDGHLHHREAARDPDGNEFAVADYPIRYLIGSGRHTRSYLIDADGFLAESPLTWYAARQAWDMSPGYDRPDHRSFERAADSTCLFCHAGQLSSPDRAYQRLTFAEQSIGCERCHGPGSLHVARQRALPAGTKASESGEQRTIVHPGRLSRSLREALCAQCHLNIDAAVIVRGRSLAEFRPGLPLSDFCINYRLDEPGFQMKVVGHVDQLHLSRCYQGSEELTCITCHDPHSTARPAHPREPYRQVCMNCHAERGCRLEAQERLRRNPANDCIACHMPQVGTDVVHVAFTHHRIGIHGSTTRSPPQHSGSLPDLVAFDDIGRFAEIDRERNLGLAYFSLAQRQGDSAAARAYRERARNLLRRVRSRGLPDEEVTAALARLYRDQDPETALALAREALTAVKLSPKSRVNCLFLTAEVGLQLHRLDLARQSLEQLIVERRLAQDWLLLGKCRLQQGDSSGALRAFEQAVAIAPFRPDLRDALCRALELSGNTEAARQQRLLAKSLTRRAASSQ